MLISELAWTKRRKLLVTAVTCTVLIGGLIMLQMGRVAEAAVLDPHPGLVGWWRFDEGVGIVAEDSSGFGNDGTVYGATWVDGKYGKALTFDGADDYVDISVISAIPNLLTIEAWIYPMGLDTAGSEISQRARTEAYNWHLYLDSLRHPRFQTYDGTNYPNAQGSAIPLNAWYHVAGVRDGTNLLLYVNGEQVASAPDTTWGNDISSGVQSAYIGASPLVTQLDFNGIIDNVRIYNRALSEVEIQDSFQKGPDFSSRLLAKVAKGTTQFIVTLSWQGDGSVNITVESPSKIYTEDMVSVYQKTVYSSGGGDMLNIKRLAISISALSSDENWYVMLEFEDVEDYRITVEVQR